MFEKRATKTECDRQVGVYFRLVREPDADCKRRAFESALASHTEAQSHTLLFRYRQLDFDAIPDKPWVYWMPKSLQEQFRRLPLLQQSAPSIHGTATYDNKRFLRFWWEVGTNRVGRNVEAWAEIAENDCVFVPYMKGGPPIPWYGNQTHVVKAHRNAREMREFVAAKRDTVRGEDYAFHPGVTWSDVSSKGFAARLSPGGFIHDVTGMTCFPIKEDVYLALGLLNSRAARYLLSALNPTIHYQVGDIERLPVPSERHPRIDEVVTQCVELAKQDSQERKLTYDFIAPLLRLENRATRKAQLAVLEAEIDTEVSRLYGLSEADLAAIDRELSGQVAGEAAEDGDNEGGVSDDEDEAQADFTPADWARSWLSYAIGTVLGRFEIGQPGGLGRGDFAPGTITALRALVDPDGIMPCDAGHSQDIVARAVQCLTLMLGAEEARTAIRTATGETGEPVEAVRGCLDRFAGTPDKSFWKYHFQLYRKRPVYWPLQSPRKKYTVWVFHEKFDKNTLFTIRKLVEERLRLLDREIADKRTAAANNHRAARELDKLLDVADDLEADQGN